MIASFHRLTFAPYFTTYLDHLESDDLKGALTSSRDFLFEILTDLDEEKWNFTYAEGKWTIKQVVNHIIETEIIFNYRALRVAKESLKEDISGFDENNYVDSAFLEHFSPKEMIAYFKAVRSSTEFLFQSLSKEQLTKIGMASGKDIQVEALFFITAGHTIHHAKVIKERYLTKI